MVRLKEDLEKSASEPTKVTRLNVWVKSRTRKDGTPVNTSAAEKIVSSESSFQCYYILDILVSYAHEI